MKRKLKYFLSLIWFTYLIVSSILLFTKGFLLTRQVQEKNSTCLPLNKIPCGPNEYSSICRLEGWAEANTNEPFLKEKYNKAHNLCVRTNFRVILLIIDALRYDFTVFNENNNYPLSYENRLPVIKNILSQSPNSSRLYKFIADPPTTTMQRLKALTTGSLPTFIDAGSNFATSEINEDNIIDQVIKNHDQIVFMGDDTWTSLYPNRFLRNYPYPSFDVWDLDTVDNGVKAKLFPELKNTDWKILIGHFLGVDHCGHRYGPKHPEMTRKLSEMNKVIEEVVEVMDDNSVLFVIGDHGMTVTGDHGGESMDEIHAAMFVYSKNPLMSQDKLEKSVKQVDLVPTLSVILGIPIPFQNLGILIRSALPTLETESTYSKSWQLSLFWMWGNVQQVISYIKSYSNHTKVFDEEYLTLYYKEYEALREKLKYVDSEEEFSRFSEKVTEFLGKIRTLCEEVWVQFDAFSISNGLTFLFLTIFFLFIIGDGIPLKHLPYAIEGSFVVVSVIGLFVSFVALAILEFSNIINNSLHSLIFVIHGLSHLLFLLPLFQNWDVISFNWYAKKKTYGIIDLICRFVLIFNICGVFSNSFINEESSVLLFLLVTLIVLSVISVASFLKTNQASKRKGDTISLGALIKLAVTGVIVLALLRISMYFWRCRVEQEWCFKSWHEVGNNRTLKSESSKLQWGVSVISLSVLVTLMKAWLRKCGNLSGYSLVEIFTKLTPPVIIVNIAGFWVLQRLAGNNISISKSSNYLALSVYILSLISVIVLVLQPVCVNVLMRNESVSLDDENVISKIFNKLRGRLNRDIQHSDSIPIVYGLGTAYSAVYIILSTYVTLVIALVLGDMFAFSAVIMIVVGAFFLLTTSILRIKKAECIDDLVNVPTITIMGWILLAQYFFYATGHQPAFPNIAWDSAFVGTTGLFSSNYIMGTLVIINTFGSYVLTGMMLPLLVIAPFTLLVMMPSVCGKQKEFYANSQNGEMLLFEKDRMAVSSLFSLSCKYIAGHTIKVFASMLAATVHCRHLMVWNVFAPKFIFDAIGLFVTLGSVLIGYLIFLRTNFQIERLVQKLNKTN